MQSIIIIDKADGKVTGVSETQVSDEVYIAMQLSLRRAGNLEAALRQRIIEEQKEAKGKEA